MRLKLLEAQYGSDAISLTVFTSKKTTHHHGRKNSKQGSQSRGSQYRGVSRNGSKFQVFIMINKTKRYFGVLEDEKTAAMIYDKIAIIFHGLKVS